jgi:hypothetical protein
VPSSGSDYTVWRMNEALPPSLTPSLPHSLTPSLTLQQQLTSSFDWKIGLAVVTAGLSAWRGAVKQTVNGEVSPCIACLGCNPRLPACPLPRPPRLLGPGPGPFIFHWPSPPAALSRKDRPRYTFRFFSAHCFDVSLIKGEPGIHPWLASTLVHVHVTLHA